MERERFLPRLPVSSVSRGQTIPFEPSGSFNAARFPNRVDEKRKLREERSTLGPYRLERNRGKVRARQRLIFLLLTKTIQAVQAA